MIRAAAAIGLVALVGGTAGCGDDGRSAGGSTGEPALTATVTRSSLFDSARTFRLELTNTGSDPVSLSSLWLDSPDFAPVGPAERDTVLDPGRLVLLPLPYGAARCPASGPAVLVAEVDGAEVRVPVDQDPDRVVDDLHAAECDEAAVHEAVALGFTDDWHPTGPTSARGAIRARVRTGRVTVESVAGNIVFGVRAPAGPLATVDERAPAARIALDVVVDRCDTHALIESKRTFQFPLTVSVGGARPVRVVLQPEGATRALFQSLLESCIAGSTE